jgi:hypothetical protein
MTRPFPGRLPPKLRPKKTTDLVTAEAPDVLSAQFLIEMKMAYLFAGECRKRHSHL